MAHGAEDYSNLRHSGNIYVLSDMAELAVRLGSPFTYERRGSVVFMYSFREGLGDFSYSGVVDGGVWSLSNQEWLSSPYSAKCVVATGVTKNGYIQKSLAATDFIRMAIHSAVRLDGSNSKAELYLTAHLNDLITEARVKVDIPNDELSYLDVNGNWQIIDDDIARWDSSTHFVNMKLSADFTTRKYKYFLIGNDGYDLSSYKMYDGGSTAYRYFLPGVLLWGQAAAPMTYYLDDFIVTHDE